MIIFIYILQREKKFERVKIGCLHSHYRESVEKSPETPTRGQMELLERVQKKAMKMIQGLRHEDL